MKMSKLSKLNLDISKIGFGCMRLPVKDEKIDREHAARMIDYAYEHGVNYYDTAYAYHGGESEEFLGEAMQKYPRESFYLASKLPIWLINSKEDMEKALNLQLKRLQTDCIDFYLIHAINKERYDKCKALDVFSFLEEKRAEGKIKYIGFSFHDNNQSFEEIVDGYEWDFAQIQLNYIDYKMMDAKYLYDILEKRDIPCVVMEPTRGGFLSNLPEDIGKIFTEYAPSKSHTSWALKWLLHLPNVKIILSGMSHMEHTLDNVSLFEEELNLSSEEIALVERVYEKMSEISTVPCTECGYCMPCPCDVEIPSVFKIYNLYKTFGNDWRSFNEYHVYFSKENKPPNCIACLKCEQVCPQQIDVVNKLHSCHDELETLKAKFENDPRTKTAL